MMKQFIAKYTLLIKFFIILRAKDFNFRSKVTQAVKMKNS